MPRANMNIKLFNRLQDNSAQVLVSWLFLRGLALIYFAAFASMAVQIEGLIGANGILPIKSVLSTIAHNAPENNWLIFPTLFWFDASDQTLRLACWVGMMAAVSLLCATFERVALILCYSLYLSISVAGQDFTAFQWDALLLEAGFLALFLTWGSGVTIFLYRWLIARFMFMGGVVKLASGDPTWANLTALNYHYQTQPLPSPLAYYAYHLPHWFNQMCVASVFVIEIIMPFLVFLPRRFRLVAAWSFIILQSSILLTGNYNFFNLLALLLCLFLFDDKDFQQILTPRLIAAIKQKQPHAGLIAHTLATIWMCIVLLSNVAHIWIYQTKQPLIAPLPALLQLTSTYSLINNYGPFAIMTTERPEIIVQGSNDGKNWLTYQFNYKPTALDQPLRWNIPHQPRLDWQMWFAALAAPAVPPWFAKFMLRLQEGSSPVLSLLSSNPFPNKPPTYVRALLYRYYYTTPQQCADTNNIWQREYLGIYWPSPI
jgi:lipase maturation factor 1